LSTAKVNSGYPSLISEPADTSLGEQVSVLLLFDLLAVSITLRLTTRSTPKRARKVPPPSFTGSWCCRGWRTGMLEFRRSQQATANRSIRADFRVVLLARAS